MLDEYIRAVINKKQYQVKLNEFRKSETLETALNDK